MRLLLRVLIAVASLGVLAFTVFLTLFLRSFGPGYVGPQDIQWVMFFVAGGAAVLSMVRAVTLESPSDSAVTFAVAVAALVLAFAIGAWH